MYFLSKNNQENVYKFFLQKISPLMTFSPCEALKPHCAEEDEVATAIRCCYVDKYTDQKVKSKIQLIFSTVRI